MLVNKQLTLGLTAIVFVKVITNFDFFLQREKLEAISLNGKVSKGRKGQRRGKLYEVFIRRL